MSPSSILNATMRNRPPSITDPSFVAEGRYRILSRMRDISPVYWDQRLGSWVVTGHSSVATVFKDERLKASRLRVMLARMDDEEREKFTPLVETCSRFLLFLDAPDHTRVRSLVHKVFTPRRVEQMRDHIRDVVNALLDELEGKDVVDLVDELAFKLPTILIAETLGVPPEDHETFRHWGEGLTGFLTRYIAPRPELFETGVESIHALTEYFLAAVARLRRQPGPDLLSALIAAEEQGDMLTQDELVSTAILILVAGHETTASLVGNAVHLLLTHPEQLELLKADPSLMPGCVDECLRYESAIQLTARIASEPIELDGKSIQEGQLVVLSLGGANRDPAVFENPDTFDITRPKNPHVAFGHGPHYCIGSVLTRAEGAIALTELFRRFPSMELVSGFPDWHPYQALRSLSSLEVHLHGRP